MWESLDTALMRLSIAIRGRNFAPPPVAAPTPLIVAASHVTVEPLIAEEVP